jgi:hypothetical protein
MDNLMTLKSNIPQLPFPATPVRWLLILTVGWVMLGPQQSRAHAAASREYQIKAACLLNFAQFVEWPAAAFAKPDSPIIIGVLGDDPFGDALESTFHDESIHGRPLVVRRSRELDDLKSCHLLFISKSEKSRLSEILSGSIDTAAVTVGEIDEFAQRGGIINFYIDNAKIRFEVNPDAAQRKGLKIGSQLLKRARIVGSDPRKGRE